MSCLDALNPTSLDTLCAALCYAIDIEPPKHAAAPNEDLVRFVDESFGGKKCDRLFMYNPDAVAQWLFEKYEYLFQEVMDRSQLQLPLRSPMPPVTPVCFGTMYTGAQPEVHGIQKYTKPVITVDTFFDALLRAGKRVVIQAVGSTCSMSKIFLERNMDYRIYENLDDLNAETMRMIAEDQYDVIICYNGNYDFRMHKFGPESTRSLAEIRCNTRYYALFHNLINHYWKGHNTLMGFAMDHGCHNSNFYHKEKLYLGDHGDETPEDMNILHFYSAIPGENC